MSKRNYFCPSLRNVPCRTFIYPEDVIFTLLFLRNIQSPCFSESVGLPMPLAIGPSTNESHLQASLSRSPEYSLKISLQYSNYKIRYFLHNYFCPKPLFFCNCFSDSVSPNTSRILVIAKSLILIFQFASLYPCYNSIFLSFSFSLLMRGWADKVFLFPRK